MDDQFRMNDVIASPFYIFSFLLEFKLWVVTTDAINWVAVPDNLLLYDTYII